MSVLLETSLGDIVIDLYTEECPRTSLNFLKLCKIKYYNFSPFHNVQKGFTAQTGDPTGKGDGGSSIYGILNGPQQRYFPAEIRPNLKHQKRGTVSMAVSSSNNNQQDDIELGAAVSGSQFFITLGEDLDYLDGKYTIFGEVAEGWDTLDKINAAYCDEQGRPYRDIRIRHTIILDDPFDDPEGLQVPDESPVPTKEQLESMRIGDDEALEEEGDPEELEKLKKQREAKAQALTLEMVGDLPFAEVKPPENILFVCKLNPVTRDEDLELIFSRFGKINSCEIIRDRQTGESLSYAFIEFDERDNAEEAYFKMQSVLIDDRRIHVDFSQSVSKLHKDWISKRMQANSSGKSMGGFNDLQKRTRYREGNDKQRGDNYDLVFDEHRNSSSSSSSKRHQHPHRSSSDRSPSNRYQHHRRHSRSPDRNRSHRDKPASSSSSSSYSDHRRDHRDRDYRSSDRDRDRNRDKDRNRDRDRDRDRDRRRY
ncbi:cyclophilin-like domain-containing protein [Cunninghamella echinulata]|nr:cyclophilin-like domain-containing protein [Cunninghamella echinulata]